MDFAFSEEQEEFRETLRRFFEEKATSADVRRMMESPEGYDPALWKQMSEELGLPGIRIPEAYGGQGFGFLELGIVQEEMGRVLLPSPFLASVVLAGETILAAGTAEQKQALLPGIASGATLATLALTEAGGRWDAEGVALPVELDGDAFRLTGRKTLVLDAAIANLLLVAARTPGTTGAEGISLYVVPADDPGVTITPLETLDPLRRQSHVELDRARGTLLGPEDAAWPLLARVLDRAAIALAAEMTGAAERCLDLSVAYARERIQFGRPIGSFQAIKHKAAEVLLEVESAKSAAWWASWVADSDGEDLAEAASLAKAFCADALARAAAENLQIHGGLGFTWENDAQLYYKRARSSDILLGDASWHRARLAEGLGF